MMVCISLSWTPLTSFPRAIEYPAFCMHTALLASAPFISNPKLVAPKPQQLLCISHSPHAGHSWKPYEHASGTTEPEREATAVEYTHCQLYPAKALSTYEFHGEGCYLHFSSSAQILSHESNEKLVDLTNITKSLT